MVNSLTVCLLLLILMQVIAKDPVLLYTYEDGETIQHDPDAIVYTKFCPYDRQLLSCWLVSDYKRVDSNPDYVDSQGYRHWHDTSLLRQEWICECGHRWAEVWTNGACWCGWKPWSI